jgi:hypothetical protein
MYCPNCGKTNSTEQKFCRSCGLSMEKVVQSLAEQLLIADLDKNLIERRRKLERWIKTIAGATIAILVGSVMWGIIYGLIIVKGEVLTGLVFLSFIIGLILFALLMLYRESLLKASGKGQPQPPALPHTGDTAKLLSEPQLEPIPSITERTTELPTVENKGNTK